MAVNPIPDGFHTVTPYIVVADIDQFLDFLKAAFAATEKERVPSQDGRTGHAEALIGDSYVRRRSPLRRRSVSPARTGGRGTRRPSSAIRT